MNSSDMWLAAAVDGQFDLKADDIVVVVDMVDPRAVDDGEVGVGEHTDVVAVVLATNGGVVAAFKDDVWSDDF